MENNENTLYCCEITFLFAENVPVADLRTFSCDPYLYATLQAHSYSGYSETSISYRTHTMRNTLHPTFNSRWIVSGIPSKGFMLTVRLVDEDANHRDDRLGRTLVLIPNPQNGNTLHESWDSGEIAYKVEKRRGSLSTYLYTYLASMATRGKVSHHVRVWIRVRVLGKAENQSDRRVYTVGPPRFSRHFSPLIGHIVSGGTARNELSIKGKNNKSLGATTFVANRFQLKGPPPHAFRHRYVGYAPFIQSLFKKSGIRGKILHFGLKRQFKTIYGYNKNTVYGVAGKGEINTDPSKKDRNKHTDEKQENGTLQNPSVDENQSDSAAIAHEFLRMTSYGTAGRIFTYVITLDSEWRFTETGEEFSVDMLSKHSMHADAAKEVAFSGVFFVRRLIHPDDISQSSQANVPRSGDKAGRHSGEMPTEHPGSEDPKDYELVIDNDSGTYRPHKELLPTLEKWLSEDDNLSGLGKVTAMDAFDETLGKWKKERLEEKRCAKCIKSRRKPEKGRDGVSDQRDTETAEDGEEGIAKMAMPKRKGLSLGRGMVGSIGSGKLGSRASSVSSEEVRAVLRENVKRAEDNKDEDIQAIEEKQTAGSNSP